MLKQLGWCAALLILLPAGAEAQQASIQASARVVSRTETQSVVARHVATGATEVSVVSVPASWRWEVRSGATGESAWAEEPIASGRGGESAGPVSYAMQAGDVGELSYLFAPI